MSDAPTYSSAGVCSSCGKHVEKRYGGEGRYLPECIDCWLSPAIPRPVRPETPEPPSAGTG